MAESLMMVLIDKGMGRGDAHELMRKLALKAVNEKKSLKEVFLENKKNLQLLTKEEVDYALNPENYLGVTDNIIDRVLKKLK
jgi:adenylosuccinate lyase